MQWVAPDKGDPKYGRQCGEYRIGKVYLDGCTLYQIWYMKELLKTCNDFDECKEVAKSHQKALKAPATGKTNGN